MVATLANMDGGVVSEIGCGSGNVCLACFLKALIIVLTFPAAMIVWKFRKRKKR